LKKGKIVPPPHRSNRRHVQSQGLGDMKTTVKRAGKKKGSRSKTAKELVRDTGRAAKSIKKKAKKTLKKIFG
jgi:hypothetical protein